MYQGSSTPIGLPATGMLVAGAGGAAVANHFGVLMPVSIAIGVVLVAAGLGLAVWKLSRRSRTS